MCLWVYTPTPANGPGERPYVKLMVIKDCLAQTFTFFCVRLGLSLETWNSPFQPDWLASEPSRSACLYPTPRPTHSARMSGICCHIAVPWVWTQILKITEQAPYLLSLLPSQSFHRSIRAPSLDCEHHFVPFPVTLSVSAGWQWQRHPILEVAFKFLWWCSAC